MTRQKLTLRQIAPPIPAQSVQSDKGSAWLLNLDQIESHTGRLLSKTLVDRASVGASTHSFDQGNVLYSKLRPYLNKVYVPDSSGFCTSELVPLRPDPSLVSREYLAAYLRSAKFLSWVDQQVDGAKMPRVSMKVFWDYEIVLPSSEEQKRITAILDRADRLHRKRRDVIQMADNFLRAVFLDLFGDPDLNPHGFPRGKIRDLVASAAYGTSEKASEESGEFPILRMNNITYEGTWNLTSLKYVDLATHLREKYLAKKGDLLFNRTNSVDLVGKTAVYEQETPMAIAGYLVRVRMNAQGDPYYVSGYLNSVHGKTTLRSMAKSIIGMANINAQELQEIPILLPPINLQRKFGQIVQAVRSTQRTQRKSLADMDALSASLSARCFAMH